MCIFLCLILGDIPAKILTFEIDLKFDKIFDDIGHILKNFLKLFFIMVFDVSLIFQLLFFDI